MVRYNIGLSVLFAGVACYVLHASSRFPPSETVGIGPAYWPSFLGYCMLLLSAALLVESLLKGNAAKGGGADGETQSKKPPIDFGSPGMVCVYWLCGVFAVFCAVLHYINFMCAIVFLVPACMIILGEKRPLPLLLVTVAVPAVVYVIFAVILRIELPSAF